MKNENYFKTTGRVAGSFKTATGNVVTIVTKSGKDAFIKVLTNETDIPKNGTRVEVEGYVGRRRGRDRDGKEFYAQSFYAESFGLEKTAAERAFGEDRGGQYYDEPEFICKIAGKVLHVEGDDFKRVLVETNLPNGKIIKIWLSGRAGNREFPVKEGDMAEFVTGVYTGNRKHETLTIRDIIEKDDTPAGHQKEIVL